MAPTSPPDTAIASGGQKPVGSSISGRKPITVVRVVATTWRVACSTTAALAAGSPLAAAGSLRRALSTTIESLIASPIRPRVPRIAVKPNSEPLSWSASAARPTASSATEPIRAASRKERKESTRVAVIRIISTPAVESRPPTASPRASASPP